MLKSTALHKIKSFGGDKVRFIILYGSVSESRMKEESDIDICVYYNGADASDFRFKVLPISLMMSMISRSSSSSLFCCRWRSWRAGFDMRMIRPSSTTKPMRQSRSSNPSSADITIAWE